MRGKRGQQKVAPTALEREQAKQLERVEKDAKVIARERRQQMMKGRP